MKDLESPADKYERAQKKILHNGIVDGMFRQIEFLTSQATNLKDIKDKKLALGQIKRLIQTIDYYAEYC